MGLDLPKFYKACNPSKTLTVDKIEDRQYYIDFSSVRGGKIIEELRDNITFFSPDEPTCQLFTGHIGCGKSTELNQLKYVLQQEGFHVVHFESDQDLEMVDVDISDILLSIARQVSESLEKVKIKIQPKGFQALLTGAAKLLQTEIDVKAEASLPGIAQVSASSEGEFSLGFGIGKLTAKAKQSPDARNRLRQYLEPRTKSVLDIINQELLLPAIEKLKQQGKKGLVVIVDNLDRVETTLEHNQPEYLFVERGEQLRQLHCHVLYTIPLSLIFSNDLGRLTERFGVIPKVLPMVPVRLRSGDFYQKGIILLQKMVLARAFPDIVEAHRFGLITELFDTPETLERLCLISGGHVRSLLRLLHRCIEKERQLPLTRNNLEIVIKERCNQLVLGITDEVWSLLQQVSQDKTVTGEVEYQNLIHSMFVFEYRESTESWFDVNPILLEAKKFVS